MPRGPLLTSLASLPCIATNALEFTFSANPNTWIPGYKYILGYRRIEKSRTRNISTSLLDFVLCDVSCVGSYGDVSCWGSRIVRSGAGCFSAVFFVCIFTATMECGHFDRAKRTGMCCEVKESELWSSGAGCVFACEECLAIQEAGRLGPCHKRSYTRHGEEFIGWFFFCGQN